MAISKYAHRPELGVRWQALFDDLEAQVAALEDAELQAEVRDRSRREAARLRVVDRLRPAVGSALVVTVLGGAVVRGALVDAGADWALLDEGGRDALVALPALLGVTGLGRESGAPGSEGQVERRLDLRWALRGLARSRAGVQVVLVDGSVLGGTLDRVGADHVELAEHPPGEPRRAASVRQVRLVPFTALALVRSVPAG